MNKRKSKLPIIVSTTFSNHNSSCQPWPIDEFYPAMHACGYELSETNLNKLQKQIKTYLALHPEFKQIDEITFVYNSKNAKLGFGSDHISLIYQGELRRKPGNLFPG